MKKYLTSLLTAFALCLIVCGCGNSKPTLHLYTWADYVHPDLINEFEKRHNCRVVVDTFDSNEAMYAKLKLGSAGYDLIFPSKYILDLMQEQNLVFPIQKENIPNLKYLDIERVRFVDKSDTPIGVPYMITYSGIGYRKDRVSHPTSSWNIFSLEEYKGRMTMLNDTRETIGAALKYLGYSINTTKQEEINQAVNLILQWKKNLAKFESEQYKNGLASAEYLIAQGYSGDINQVMNENNNVGFLFPQEGLILSCDYIAIPKGAQQLELANAFIDFLYDPEIAARNMEFTCYLCPNTAAYQLLPESLKKSEILFVPTDILKKSETIEYLGAEQDKYNKAWDSIKASH